MSDDQKIIIESLAMDLKRVALGLHRGSITMAKKFQEEALKRETELKTFPLNPYLKKLTIMAEESLKKDNINQAEDALMLSTLFQNYVQK